jgi:hypothetical protein
MIRKDIERRGDKVERRRKTEKEDRKTSSGGGGEEGIKGHLKKKIYG